MTFPAAPLASLPPAVLVHLVLATGALLLGPIALWSRKGSRGHRGAGYAWVTLMIGAAVSSLFIRDAGAPLPRLAGFSPIHLLTVLTLVGVSAAIHAIVHGNVRAHQRGMKSAYIAGCLVAGSFALMPGRYLGSLLWHHTLGLV